MPLSHLEHVLIQTSDMEGTREFYTREKSTMMQRLFAAFAAIVALEPRVDRDPQAA
jgi:hypothetical protein